MALQVAQLIGGAGTGKTTELLSIMDKVIAEGIDPLSIGFCSFTRAARREASGRASARFGLAKPDELERDGWFRTLHSVCYRCLGVSDDELLTDSKESREWLKDALQEEISGTSDSELGTEYTFEAATGADVALQLWQACRNRLIPFEEVWRRAHETDERVPGLEECQVTIRRYEAAKYRDDRMDFTDLLGQYAGFKFRLEGHERREPMGWVPEVPVWFLDEYQDSSALLHTVCTRLVSESQWVYVVGDPFQSVYGFAGADAKHFMNWPVREGKRRIMPKSWRCPPEILSMGEAFLKQCSDYWDRGIAPADRHGVAQTSDLNKSLIAQCDPTESWLLIARTNFQARRMAQLLDAHNIPWSPTKGNGGWDAPVRNSAMHALYNLEQGAPIDGGEWVQVLKYLPSRTAGIELLTRGTKKKFDDLTPDLAAEQHPFVFLKDLEELGATRELIAMIVSRRWRTTVEHAERFVYAVEKWGTDVVNRPRIRVGTIHSVKGSEADNVIVSMGISTPIVRAKARPEGRDEEQRVFYVGATRARQRLILALDRRAPHNMKVPA